MAAVLPRVETGPGRLARAATWTRRHPTVAAGGVILVIGGLTTMWPGGRATVPVAAESSAQAGFEARLVGTGA